MPAGCTRFNAVVGVDDEVGTREAFTSRSATGQPALAELAFLTGSARAVSVNVNLTGVSSLRLAVADGGDGNASDHADWADAKLDVRHRHDAPTVVFLSARPGRDCARADYPPVARFTEPLNPATVTSQR